MNNRTSILLKVISWLIVISHFAVYMVIPSTGSSVSSSSDINPLNSFDDYLVESILGIEDDTPADEQDDLERVLQLVQVESFGFQLEETKMQEYLSPAIIYFPIEERLHSFISEVPVPPPQI